MRGCSCPYPTDNCRRATADGHLHLPRRVMLISAGAFTTLSSHSHHNFRLRCRSVVILSWRKKLPSSNFPFDGPRNDIDPTISASNPAFVTRLSITMLRPIASEPRRDLPQSNSPPSAARSRIRPLPRDGPRAPASHSPGMSHGQLLQLSTGAPSTDRLSPES